MIENAEKDASVHGQKMVHKVDQNESDFVKS